MLFLCRELSTLQSITQLSHLGINPVIATNYSSMTKNRKEAVVSMIYGDLLSKQPKILLIHLSPINPVIPNDLSLKYRCES